MLRSPRAALEPERVPMPTKWSKSARHPLVIAGNAVFTILILLAIIVGVGFAVGKHRFDAPGPLEADKVVNIPPRYGIRDIADLLTKEGVIEHPNTFIAGRCSPRPATSCGSANISSTRARACMTSSTRS